MLTKTTPVQMELTLWSISDKKLEGVVIYDLLNRYKKDDRFLGTIEEKTPFHGYLLCRVGDRVIFLNALSSA